MNTTNPYAPPQAAVQDVADSDSQLAGRGTRLLTMILDSIILVAMVYLPMMIGTAVSRAIPFDLLVAAGLVGWIWLTVVFVSRNGVHDKIADTIVIEA